MNRFIRMIGMLAVTSILFLATSGSALAEECFNVDKNAHNPGAGAQVVIDGTTGEIADTTNGLQNRIDRGLVDPETGDGYHGIVAIDLDGDGEADLSTFQVTPMNELPEQAQENGSPDHGIVNICAALGCP